MSQALYRKWRPATFAEVVGQEHVTRTLQNAVAADRVGHAFLFSGPRGTGKTTSARLLAKAVNCLDPDPAHRPCNRCHICLAINEGRFLDLIEIDAASNTGVDDIRDLRDKIHFSPTEGRFKVYIIDEVHMLSTAAFNALLKTLEEPPGHAKFVLATTEEHKVPATIQSRCQLFQFRLLTEAEIQGRLLWLAEKEALTIDPDALTLIARQGAGSVRDAESLLDQLVTAPGDHITIERTQSVLGTASTATVSAVTDAWLAGDGATGLRLIHEALRAGADARQLARQMVAYLRGLLLLEASGELLVEMPAEAHETMASQAASATRAGLIAAVKAFSAAATTTANTWQPQLPLELAFISLLPEVSGANPRRAGSPRRAPDPRPTTPEQVTAAADETIGTPLTRVPEEQTQPPLVRATEPPSRTVEAGKSTPEPAVDQGQAPPTETLDAGAAASGELSLVTVKSHWPDVMAIIKQQDRNLSALMASAKPLGVEGHTVVLGFDFPVLKDKFDDQPANRDLVLEALHSVHGQQCLLRTVLSSQYAPPRLVTREEFGELAEELGGVIQPHDP